jgi:methylated-DNA-protein-cysteine methyltransferase-like protein
MWEEVYKVVKKIPSGRVMTYGQVAKVLGTKDVRKIGWALHANKSSEVPCHRVVNKEGRLAKNFAFDGEVEQQRRLEAEGIFFEKDLYVDLVKYGM